MIREFVIAAAQPGSREGEKLRTVSRATVGALVLAYACLIPQISSDYVVGLLILMAIYAIVSMAWNPPGSSTTVPRAGITSPPFTGRIVMTPPLMVMR